MSLKGKQVEIEFSEDDMGYRSVIRQWVEIAGLYEIVYQEYDEIKGCWVDDRVTPAYCKEDLESLRDAIDVILERFV